MPIGSESIPDYAEGHVRRALAREEAREARRRSKKQEASEAARVLRARYGDGIAIYVFGSVLEPNGFRLDSDVDLAVRGLPVHHYYEAWRLAEAAMVGGRLDLVRLEAAPDWLVAEVEECGERIA